MVLGGAAAYSRNNSAAVRISGMTAYRKIAIFPPAKKSVQRLLLKKDAIFVIKSKFCNFVLHNSTSLQPKAKVKARGYRVELRLPEANAMRIRS